MFSQATLGLFTGKKWQISLPTYILQLVKSLLFHILEAHQGLAYISGGIPIIRASAKSMEELWSPGFGIAFMDDTRDLALLWNGIREIVTLKPLDPGFLTAKIFKIYSTLAVSNDWKTGNLSWAFPPRWHAAAARQRSVRQETTMERAGTLLPPYLYHREVQPGNSVSLEPAGKWDGRSGTGDKDDKEGVLEYDLFSSDEDSEEQSLGDDNDEGDNDVGDIKAPLDSEANFLLGTVSRFGKTIRVSNVLLRE